MSSTEPHGVDADPPAASRAVPPAGPDPRTAGVGSTPSPPPAPTPRSTPTPSPEEIHNRGVYRRLLVRLAVAAGGVGLGGALVGQLLAGRPGLIGALLGAGLTLLYCGTTAVVMWATAHRTQQVAMLVLVGSWLGKTLVTLVAVAALAGAHFYDRVAFVLVVAAGVIASLAVDIVTMRDLRLVGPGSAG